MQYFTPMSIYVIQNQIGRSHSVGQKVSVRANLQYQVSQAGKKKEMKAP